MSQQPIEGVGKVAKQDENGADAAIGDQPGAFTGDFETKTARAVGNNEWTLGQWTALAIQRTHESPQVDTPELETLQSDPAFIEKATQFSLTRPNNKSLQGRGSDHVLQDNEEYFTSFGAAIKELAAMHSAGLLDKLLDASSHGAPAAPGQPTEAHKEQLRAIGQVPSVGLPVPTRIPGDS